MSSSPALPPFVTTPVQTIEPTHARLNQAFFTLKSYPIEYRLEQLNKLYWAIKDNEQLLADALHADLNKPYHEAYIAEINWLQTVILYVMKNLQKWAEDEPLNDLPLTSRLFHSPRMRKEPMGIILIIGPWNYPFQLVLHPLIGAISGGNAAVVKPSELAPNSAAVITRIVEALDPNLYATVNGAVEETTKLLDQKWDKIVYTGNGRVGRIVAAAAAKHLTPLLLELGGINPAFVTSSADATIAAKRISWGKIHNTGQVCLAPNYVFVHSSKEQTFVQAFIQAISTYLPNGAKGSPDLARIIDKRAFHRIKGLLDNTKGTIICGGGTDEASLFIEPTLVKVYDINDCLMGEEIFGPVLPILVVDEVEEMLSLARRLGDTPLAMYIFSGDKEEQERMMRGLRSGGVSINDIILHASLTNVPFGGVGESGYGKYRGRDTFDSFTHKRPVLSQPLWIEGQLKMRYSPYTPESLKLAKKVLGDPTPQYPRDWKPGPQPLWQKLMLLGAGGVKGGVMRYLLVFVVFCAVFRKQLGDRILK